MCAATVHPFIAFTFFVVVIGQWKMWRGIAQGFAHLHAFGIQLRGHAANGWLRAFIVYVPRFEVLQWPCIHHNERRMNHRPCVHQRAT